MAAELEPLSVLAAYSHDCRPNRVEWLGSAGGFSGARFWRLDSPRGTLCLRCWPKGHPSAERLEFIQAVLWHVVREGFSQVPLPLSTRQNKGYVRQGGHFWELAPWMPGEADFIHRPTDTKLRAAMVALARFHRAAETFPLPYPPGSPSPGIRDRIRQLQTWISGDLERLIDAIEPGLWPEFERRATTILQLVPQAAGGVLTSLHASGEERVSLQPCIRDVWHDHVLFQGERVVGLIDFGSMAAENVAADIARLLGSMARDDRSLWQMGIAAYRTVRPLSNTEEMLTSVFDRSTVLMAGLNWIDWVYRQRRVFDDRSAVQQRLDDIILRLRCLVAE